MQPERAHYAAGDYLTRYPEGDGYQLRIDAPFEKPGWKARSFSPTGQSIFPGTAIEFEGKYYEITFQDYEPGPPMRICYFLNAWEERFPIRVQFHYNKEECRNTALAYRDRLKSNQQRVFLTLLSPLLGMLPAEDQIRIGNKFGMDATRLTFVSGLVQLVPSAFLIIFFLSSVFGKVPLPGPFWIHWIYPAGFYFFAESLMKMLTASKLEEPVGSLILSFPILTARAFLSLLDPARRQKKFEKLEPLSEKERSSLASAEDQLLPSADGETIEVFSMLPKPHWNPRIGIALGGTWYGLVDSEKIKRGNEIHYRFVLKRAPEGTWFAAVIEYSPDEVQQLYKSKRLLDLKTWVDTFAFLWGLLSHGDQTRLEDLYEFDSLKFTRITFVTIAVLSTANLIVSVMNFLGGLGTRFDVLVAIIAAFFLAESIFRWKDWRIGEPSGSVLGAFFRPFARKLLQGP